MGINKIYYSNYDIAKQQNIDKNLLSTGNLAYNFWQLLS